MVPIDHHDPMGTMTATSTRTVLLAGRDARRTAGWHEELRTAGGWQVMPHVHSFAQARVLLHRHDPALLITDLRLADGPAVDMVRVLRSGTSPLGTQVLVVAHGQDPLLLDALQAGADNFHDLDDAKAPGLAEQALDTLSGGAEIAPWIARRLLDHFGVEAQAAARPHVASPDALAGPLELTAAERQLLRQLSIGQRIGDVARLIGLAPRDLAAHVRTIYRKMQWGLRAGDLSLAPTR